MSKQYFFFICAAYVLSITGGRKERPVVQRNSFKHVYTGIDKTVKRAVPLKIIRQIRELDLDTHP